MPPAPQVLTLSPLTIRGKVQGGQTMVALVSLWYNVMVTSTFTPPPYRFGDRERGGCSRYWRL